MTILDELAEFVNAERQALMISAIFAKAGDEVEIPDVGEARRRLNRELVAPIEVINSAGHDLRLALGLARE